MSENSLQVKTMADMAAAGEEPEVLFWVGCAGSFDQRAQKITKAFVKILNSIGMNYAVLGTEENCTGDPARRAGNEFVFQMSAMMNIETLNAYNVKRIVTTCPHCFNILKNEYPELGGNYEVIHHSVFLQKLIDEGRIVIQEENKLRGSRITFHDSCFLGRANGIYEAPRAVIRGLKAELIEMKRCGSNGLCCGAGGAQMFKEPEPGNKQINIERIEEAAETEAGVVASSCPFCMTMLTDGIKEKDKEQSLKVYDIAELIAQANDL